MSAGRVRIDESATDTRGRVASHCESSRGEGRETSMIVMREVDTRTRTLRDRILDEKASVGRDKT
jgi:hypothetical protein